MRKNSSSSQLVRQIHAYYSLACASAGHPEIGQPLCVECYLLLLATAGPARVRQHGRARDGDGHSLPGVFSAGMHAIGNGLSSGRARGWRGERELGRLDASCWARPLLGLVHQRDSTITNLGVLDCRRVDAIREHPDRQLARRRLIGVIRRRGRVFVEQVADLAAIG